MSQGQLHQLLTLYQKGGGRTHPNLTTPESDKSHERFRQITKDHARFPSIYPDPRHAAVLEFSIDLGALGALDTLAFVQPTDDWLDFVRYCRLPGGRTHKAHGNYYEAVYGPAWRFGADAHPGWEQLSFHMDYPVTSLLRLQTPIRRGGPRL